jgi:hypothetical protein
VAFPPKASIGEASAAAFITLLGTALAEPPLVLARADELIE